MVELAKRIPSPFNSAVDTGLRMLVLLEAAAPVQCDLGRLVIYDYLLVHSEDAPNGPRSLHPATPHRSGELLVRRKMLLDGLLLLISRELAAVTYGPQGITYAATDLAKPFLSHLDSGYARGLRDRANWVSATFGIYTNESLSDFAMSHLNDWGGELVNTSLVRRSETTS